MNIKLDARAKINLSLDVLRRREDGYHEVRMIMQSLGLCDEVELEKTAAGISLSVSREANGPALSEIPGDERNLMWRAAKLMQETYGLGGVRMHLVKRIPAAAGLAGGSADAAAVFKGMNALYELQLPASELQALSAKLGADIPYCILGGTALSEGIGERLLPLLPAPSCGVLLIKPERGVSTKQVYEALRIAERPKAAHPDVDAALSAIREKNLQKLAACMGNVLELVTVPMLPEIAEIKEAMYAAGADGAMMSGSGPTVFGLFSDREKLKEAAEAFRSGAYREFSGSVIETEFYPASVI